MDGGTTGGIEVGNYIFATNSSDTSIPEGARVTDIQINNAIVIDKPCAATKSVACTFIDHRGFVKRMLTQGKNASTYDVNFWCGFDRKFGNVTKFKPRSNVHLEILVCKDI